MKEYFKYLVNMLYMMAFKEQNDISIFKECVDN
jgi:hypothetical protein